MKRSKPEQHNNMKRSKPEQQGNNEVTNKPNLFAILNTEKVNEKIVGFLSIRELIHLIMTSKALFINDSKLLDRIIEKIEQSYEVTQLVAVDKHSLAL